MKIVYILHESNLYGGATKSFLAMLRKLVEKGIKPFVIMPQKGELYNELLKDNIKTMVVWYQFQIYPDTRNLKKSKNLILFIPRLIKMVLTNIRAQTKIIDIIKEFNPDLIHTNVGVIHIGYNISKKLNIPHIWHIREYQTEDFGMLPFPNMSNFRKKIKNKHNNCIAITQSIFDYFGMIKKKDIVIYNGVATKEEIRFSEIKKDYFLYVGRLDESKGIEFLLYAYNELCKDCNVDVPKLLIAGKGTAIYEKKLFEILQKNNLNNKIEFLGNRNDVPDLMYMAKALIVPSFSEGFGRITAEALFNGCLVIGYNNAGTKEILSSKKIGLLYDNECQLIKYLKDIIENGVEKYYSIIHRSQEVALNLYTIERNANLVYEFYESILKEKNK